MDLLKRCLETHAKSWIYMLQTAAALQAVARKSDEQAWARYALWEAT